MESNGKAPEVAIGLDWNGEIFIVKQVSEKAGIWQVDGQTVRSGGDRDGDSRLRVYGLIKDAWIYTCNAWRLAGLSR